MRARRGANFATNAVPFFAFMVGGSYGISVLLQVRDRKAWTRVFPASRMPTRALTTPNTTDPPARIPPEQGRNDVRDAKADVTDMRAPGKTQRVRRKNRAFDLEAENEVRVFRVFRRDRRRRANDSPD